MLLPCMMRMLLLWNIGRKGIIFLMEAVALLGTVNKLIVSLHWIFL